jgi:CBS-domain-containing membrane protein
MLSDLGHHDFWVGSDRVNRQSAQYTRPVRLQEKVTGRELSDKQNGSEHRTTTNTPWRECASEVYLPSDRRFSAKLVPTFVDTERHVVSVTDPYGRIIGFIDRSRYLFFQVAPQLYSRG